MKGAVLHAPGDVRFEERAEPAIVKPTDAVIRVAVRASAGPTSGPIAVRSPSKDPRRWDTSTAASSKRWAARCTRSSRGSSSSAPSATSDNTCPALPVRLPVLVREPGVHERAQAPMLRVPHADGTLVPTPGLPSEDLLPSLLTISDVLGTGWFAAEAANVKPGSTVAVVGDGAVGLLGVLSAKQMGAERIIAMSRHEARQKLAREFGATDIVTERGDEGVARIKDLTKGVGADAVLECVGTQESMWQAIRATRPGGTWAMSACRTACRSMERVVLHARAAARRPGAGAALPAQADRPGLEGQDRSRQGVRPHAAPRSGRGGLPRHGRAARHQGPAAAVTCGQPGTEAGAV